MPPKQSPRIQIQHQENPKMSNSPNTTKIENTTDIKIYTEILHQNQVQESKSIPTETLKKKNGPTHHFLVQIKPKTHFQESKHKQSKPNQIKPACTSSVASHRRSR